MNRLGKAKPGNQSIRRAGEEENEEITDQGRGVDEDRALLAAAAAPRVSSALASRSLDGG